MNNPISQLKKGQKIAFWATIITILLAVLKGVVGYIFHSDVLIADAFHSGADAIAIFASAFGLWLASREKSERFPYGLFKAETFVTLIIGGLICWAGIELFLDGWQKLFFIPLTIKFPLLPVIVTIISIVTAFLVARKEKQVGGEINSHSLIANAHESFLDIISSAVVLLGILMLYWQIPYAEGITIIIIALLIIKLGMENAWQSLLVLLDANLEPELRQNIERAVLKISGVETINDCKIRQAGPFQMIELKFTTNPSISIYQAHAISDEIENLIQTEFDSVESVFVHMEPSRRKELRAIIPVAEVNGLESRIYGHFGRAPYFVILKIEKGNVEIEDFYLNEFLELKHHIGIKVINVILQYDLDMLFTNQIGEISFYALKENFIDIYRIGEENLSVKQGIELYKQNKLSRITVPTHTVDESITES
jgi:cation diffusion facilitator family transporter